MKTTKTKGRIAKRMAFYSHIRKISLGKLIVRDIREHVALLSKLPS